MDGSMAESVQDQKVPANQRSSNSDWTQLTPMEMVAKAIAPVKKGFIRPPPTRTSYSDEKHAVPLSSVSSSTVMREKKSKRQLKRERLQERKSASNLCPEVAKTRNVSSCPYSDKCRLSHDIEAFKAQKPSDLEGDCPFRSDEGSCPYGLACRFAGTHLDDDATRAPNVLKISTEMNSLNKDVQKLLWKNKMIFPKANAKLRELGLLPNAKMKALEEEVEAENVVSNGINENDQSEVANESENREENCLKVPEEVDFVNGTSHVDAVRPSKKHRSEIEENCCSDEIGVGIPSGEFEKGHTQIKLENTTDRIVTEDDRSLKLHPREKKIIDFKEKLYLAPLTTVGNLPFRRICKGLGADITCGEMAMCTNLFQGQASEWALLRRHVSEDVFGVQICGAYPDTVARAVELIDQECSVDFIDINMGCPIDIVVNKGAGSALLTKRLRMKSIIEAASGIVDIPITLKVRTGYFEGRNKIDSIIGDVGQWGAAALTIHGRSRQQRYSKLADWEYIYQCARNAKAGDALQVLGNGDIFSYLDWNKHVTDCPQLSTCMIARGALIKPWLFSEIKEQRHWDITSGERLNILKDYVRFGLEHWGSDSKGVETTRHFLLEWLSYTHRYIPVGLLEVVPQRLNWRPPSYYGRDELETLMASDSAADWIRISEILLCKVPDGFKFAPKHKSNAYDTAENG